MSIAESAVDGRGWIGTAGRIQSIVAGTLIRAVFLRLCRNLGEAGNADFLHILPIAPHGATEALRKCLAETFAVTVDTVTAAEDRVGIGRGETSCAPLATDGLSTRCGGRTELLGAHDAHELLAGVDETRRREGSELGQIFILNVLHLDASCVTGIFPLGGEFEFDGCERITSTGHTALLVRVRQEKGRAGRPGKLTIWTSYFKRNFCKK